MRFYKIPFQASFVISDACRLNYDNEIFGGPMKIKMQQLKMDQTWICFLNFDYKNLKKKNHEKIPQNPKKNPLKWKNK